MKQNRTDHTAYYTRTSKRVRSQYYVTGHTPVSEDLRHLPAGGHHRVRGRQKILRLPLPRLGRDDAR